VTHGVDPEFKPQYHKKRKKKDYSRIKKINSTQERRDFRQKLISITGLEM
jgi:hypothetical protein